MVRGKAKKVIQVPIDEDLLECIDETAGRVAESRAAFIRDACEQRLRILARGELDRRYVDGYRRKPEDAKWAQTGARLLSRVLAREKW